MDHQDTRDRVIAQGAMLTSLMEQVEANTGKLDKLIALQHELAGAAKAGRWIGHGLTAIIAFTVSKIGMSLPLPLPRLP